MEETNWDSYGTGNYEKCADCMVHCGFEATAVEDAFNLAYPVRYQSRSRVSPVAAVEFFIRGG